jgi:hypothetical protein
MTAAVVGKLVAQALFALKAPTLPENLGLPAKKGGSLGVNRLELPRFLRAKP